MVLLARYAKSCFGEIGSWSVPGCAPCAQNKGSSVVGLRCLCFARFSSFSFVSCDVLWNEVVRRVVVAYTARGKQRSLRFHRGEIDTGTRTLASGYNSYCWMTG